MFKNKKILITAADYPDLDGVACAIAYADYKNQLDKSNQYIAKFGINLQIEPIFVVKELGLVAEILDEEENFDKFILVDACENKGLPKVLRTRDVTEVIDHRLFPEYEAFPNAEFRIEPVGAAATQIAEFFYFNQEIEIKPEIASLLVCAIYSNTISFQSENTTFRDERMRSWLETKISKENIDLPKRMFEYKTNYALENLEEALLLDARPSEKVLYQLEVDSSKSLIERKEEIFKLFKKLFPQILFQCLIIQDASIGKTFIITDRKEVVNLLNKAKLPGSWISENVLELEKIFMRKEIRKIFN